MEKGFLILAESKVLAEKKTYHLSGRAITMDSVRKWLIGKVGNVAISTFILLENSDK